MKVCDPIHGFVRFNSLEKRVIDSRYFQRLRYIRQMGVTYLIYPGATHSRFEHSLGVMEIADKIYSKLVKKSDPYWRQIVRLAALCHDMGHLPFSHTAETCFLEEGGHEEMTRRIVESDELRQIWKEVGPHACSDIVKLAVEEHDLEMTPWEKFLSQIIMEDNFGADRIDYLLRDSYYTGANYGHFDYHQLIDSLRLIETPSPMIGVSSSGMQSVESLWIARYLMYSRVAHLPKVRLFSQHMKRVMEIYFKERGFPKNVEEYVEECDYTILNAAHTLANRGNYDAAAILQRKAPFVEVAWKQTFNEKSLQKEFSSNVIIDHVQQKKGERDFPVLMENQEKVSAKLASPFLNSIPLGAKGPFLYVHPDWKGKISSYLSSTSL